MDISIKHVTQFVIHVYFNSFTYTGDDMNATLYRQVST